MNLDEVKALEPMTEVELQAVKSHLSDYREAPDLGVADECARLLDKDCERLLALAAAHKVMVEEAEKWRRMAFHPLGDNHHNAAKCPHCGDPLGKAESKAAALEGQVKALREALERIEDYPDAAEVQRVARAALAAVPVQPKEDA